jgi:hypothetical protein
MRTIRFAPEGARSKKCAGNGCAGKQLLYKCL